MVTTSTSRCRPPGHATIAESTGRANVFLGAVSGGLVALGLIAGAAGVGSAFTAFGLVLLPTLCYLGLVTFERVLHSGIEDHFYGRRIAQLRSYYFDRSPGLVRYLFSVPREGRLQMHALPVRRSHDLLTVAGMVAVIVRCRRFGRRLACSRGLASLSVLRSRVRRAGWGRGRFRGVDARTAPDLARARGEVMFVEEVPEGATQVHWHAHAGAPGQSSSTWLRRHRASCSAQLS